MPYKYLEEIATADVAFKAWGATLEELFIAASDATVNIMIENIDSVSNIEKKVLEAEDVTEEFVLFQILQELIFLKDAYQLIMRIEHVSIQKKQNRIIVTCRAYGEVMNPHKHHLALDVKAVTLHQFRVYQTERGWEAKVILDI